MATRKRRSRKVQSAAILTVKDCSKMTPAGRRRIAAWVRKQAQFIEQYGREFAGTCRMRYLYD